MRTNLTKVASILCLIIVATLSTVVVGTLPIFYAAICAGALVVGLQALQARKFAWAVAFVAVAAVFNPVKPLLANTGDLFILIVCLSVVLFAVSLRVLRTAPLLTIPSIVRDSRRRESL